MLVQVFTGASNDHLVSGTGMESPSLWMAHWWHSVRKRGMCVVVALHRWLPHRWEHALVSGGLYCTAVCPQLRRQAPNNCFAQQAARADQASYSPLLLCLSLCIPCHTVLFCSLFHQWHHQPGGLRGIAARCMACTALCGTSIPQDQSESVSTSVRPVRLHPVWPESLGHRISRCRHRYRLVP